MNKKSNTTLVFKLTQQIFIFNLCVAYTPVMIAIVSLEKLAIYKSKPSMIETDQGLLNSPAVSVYFITFTQCLKEPIFAAQS